VQIKDLTIDEFKVLIRETVEDALQDLLLDPDQGRPLKDSVRQQLLAMRERRLEHSQAIPAAQVIDELGLN
jgi:CHASE3 domain sensor protein